MDKAEAAQVIEEFIRFCRDEYGLELTEAYSENLLLEGEEDVLIEKFLADGRGV